MRLLVACGFLALAVAGCAEEPDEAPDLLGWCPQWAPGETFDVGGELAGHGAADSVFIDPVNESDGRPFDVVRLDLDVAVTDGVLFLEAHDVEGGHPAVLRDHRLEPGRQVQPLVRFTQDQQAVIEASLNPIDAEDLHSGPVRLEWRLEGNGTAAWSGEATAMYRVCGR